MIPIKGYATFDPLKHCWIGSGFKAEMFQGLQIYHNDKIMDPIKRIAEETEEDYQTLEKILKDAGIITHRSFLNMEKIGSLENGLGPRAHGMQSQGGLRLRKNVNHDSLAPKFDGLSS